MAGPGLVPVAGPGLVPVAGPAAVGILTHGAPPKNIWGLTPPDSGPLDLGAVAGPA
ncbi:MAG: hypothetical protein ACRC7H_04185 [Plesiomonas shigelloides]